MTKEEFDKLPGVFYITTVYNIDDIDYGPFKCEKYTEDSIKVHLTDWWFEQSIYTTSNYFLTYYLAKQEVIRLLTIQRDKWQKRIDRLQTETIIE